MKESFEACLAMKENLEAVFNAVYDGIISLNASLQVVNMNDAALGFFGVTREEALGKLCFCEDFLPELGEVLESTLKKNTPIKNFSIIFTDREAEQRTIILSTALLKENDTVNGVALIIHDISEIRRLQQKLDVHPSYFKLIGRNHKMQEIYTLIDKVARSDAPVLIEGESGSGKGLVAEAIHQKSARRDAAFVKVNCAALSESLLESELFGHVKGAFTGAFKDRIGRFETAQRGTIFLDEIGEIPPQTQVKLLNVLQDKVIERVGETKSLKVDVRIISATNQHLKQLARQNMFREDLYYRLKVVRIVLPPLRERIDDLPVLVDHFMEKQRKETKKPIETISGEAMRALTRYRWPGNVRELDNAIAQAFVLCDDESIGLRDLPEEVISGNSDVATSIHPPASGEAGRIEDALRHTGGKKGAAAARLGIDRTTLWRKMKEFQIS